MLTTEQINDLHRLYWSEHWPIRKIERHLNMGWKTIRKYLDAPGQGPVRRDRPSKLRLRLRQLQNRRSLRRQNWRFCGCFTSALTANAASFLLPILNPANLVVYGRNLPPLLPWLGSPHTVGLLHHYHLCRSTLDRPQRTGRQG
jgi:hypothetical protein